MTHKQYDVYGLGNALLDLEIKVTTKELARHGLDKGVMTLVDAEEHQRLLSLFSDREMIKACGGSAANTMIALSQFGARTFLSCRVANDASGHLFLKDLESHLVQSNLSSSSLPVGVTGKCLALIDEDADRTMMTHLGATTDFSITEIDETVLVNSNYLYVEGYLVASETAKAASIHAINKAQQHAVKTSLTLSDLNMVKFFKSGLIEMMGNDKLDILFCNEAEATTFTDETEIKAICTELKRYAKNFVMTLGERGAILFDGKDLHNVPGVSVNVIDTLGAGDMFAGAYLYEITQGKTPVEAAYFANRAAAKIVTHFGPRLPKKKLASLVA